MNILKSNIVSFGKALAKLPSRAVIFLALFMSYIALGVLLEMI